MMIQTKFLSCQIQGAGMERKDVHIHIGNLFSDSIKRDIK